MTRKQRRINRKLFAWPFPTLLCGMLLSGCVGLSSSSKSHSTGSPPATTSAVLSAAPRPRHFSQDAAPALAACKRAVARPRSLPASAKQEISALCDRINDVIGDNEDTVRAVCQELANAVSTPNALAKNRAFSDCYAEYAKTIK
jgi:hypothetical protein